MCFFMFLDENLLFVYVYSPLTVFYNPPPNLKFLEITLLCIVQVTSSVHLSCAL